MQQRINWSTEWLTTLGWVLGVYLASVLVFLLVGRLLIRRTGWGRQFWRLSRDYFVPRQRSWLGWRPVLTVALLLLFTVISVRIDVLLSYVNNDLFTALQQLNPPTFWRSLAAYAVIALLSLALTLISFYIGQAQIIQWRQWLNQRLLDDWLSGAAYHRGRFVAHPIDNPDQRIQSDIASFASASQKLALGAISSLISLVSFTLILWQLSGPLSVLGLQIPRAMVFLAYLYVIVATVIAFRIGRPLIRLNFLSELLNASYRYALVRVRENSESIALYRGERVENATLGGRFAAVIANTWAIVFRSLKFQGFNVAVNLIAGVFPLVIQAPRAFAGEITIGDISQTGSAFAQVQGSLSFFRLAYDDFASYRASLNRLTGLLDVDEEARALPSAAGAPRPAGLGVDDLDVLLPDGRPLLTGLSLDLPAGAFLLVRGPSGSGKTTLLRSLAGLWPYVRGSVERPEPDGVLFCSQQPYLPLGSLRTALTYPRPVDEVAEPAVVEVLRAVQLGHLAGRLDEERDWSHTLSPGEQQRLTFARLLVAAPVLVFLDEATAALDEGMEHAMYDLLHERLPECTVVSVGHRGSLVGLHTSELELLGDGRWENRSLVP